MASEIDVSHKIFLVCGVLASLYPKTFNVQDSYLPLYRWRFQYKNTRTSLCLKLGLLVPIGSKHEYVQPCVDKRGCLKQISRPPAASNVLQIAVSYVVMYALVRTIISPNAYYLQCHIEKHLNSSVDSKRMTTGHDIARCTTDNAQVRKANWVSES